MWTELAAVAVVFTGLTFAFLLDPHRADNAENRRELERDETGAVDFRFVMRVAFLVVIAIQVAAAGFRASDGEWLFASTHGLVALYGAGWLLESAWHDVARRGLQSRLAQAWQLGFADGREDVYGGDHPNPYRRDETGGPS